MHSLIVALALAAFSCSWVSAPGDQEPTPAFEPAGRPNVVLFVVDDLGWSDVGFMGNTFVETPRADALAAEGMIFRTAYSNAPNCTPSRASLLTGTWPPRTGIYTVRNETRGDERLRRWLPVETRLGFEEGRATLATALRDAGWRTAAIGKWHLSSDPRAAGFETALGGDDHGAPRDGHFSPYGIRGFEDGPEGESLAERLTDEALSFVRADPDRPFLLYLSHYSVHAPVQATNELRLKYSKKPRGDDTTKPGYAGMIEALDSSLGRLLDSLDELGLAEDTIFVFASDNGASPGLSDLRPLRGGKGTLHEGGLRIPLAVRWPGEVSAGSSCEAPVILSDLPATLLAACGVEAPGKTSADGVDLLPVLRGADEPPERALYWHSPVYLKPDAKRSAPFRAVPSGALRRGDLKLVESFEDGTLRLFDLREDPGEEHDLAQELPEVTAALHAELRAWRERTGAEVPTEPNPAYDPELAAAAERSQR